MKRLLGLLIAVIFIIGAVAAQDACAGWKENYREKYSKKTVDPDSERAQKLRRLVNIDTGFIKKWRKTPQEKKAIGEEPMTTLTEHIMPWKKRKDKSEEPVITTTNFSPARTDMVSEDDTPKSGYTLTGCVKKLGENIGIK